ncbi:chromate transporter [Paenibacillus koleovorans]|uniref:chromate transporter n=1 Tax=Paenibacillus koleovorans TaxID=121608 RepID=UPI000FDC58F5
MKWNWSLQRDIFIGFLRSGLLGYGGGPSTIPLVHREVVDRYRWMTNEEFTDVLALGNALPGPIATKMAGYIGYRLAGFAGLVNALIATVLPTVVGMLGLIGVLSAFRESRIVAGMTQAIAPVIAVMLAAMTWQLLRQSRRELGWYGCIGLTLGSAVLCGLLDVHPAFVILVLLGSALGSVPVVKRWKARKASAVKSGERAAGGSGESGKVNLPQ